MELNAFSPDVHAWLCYLVVLSLGVFTGLGNVARLLSDHRGFWQYPRTWLLFFIYMAMPIAFFWLLDALGVIHDTSIVAAILVGIAYQQIITGGISVLSVPGKAVSLWKPLEAYAEGLARRIAQQRTEHLRRVEDELKARISDDPERTVLLGRVAFQLSSNPDGLADEIAAEEARRGQLPDGAVGRRIVNRYFQEVKRTGGPEEWGEVLRANQVISSRSFWRLRGSVGTLFAIIGLVALLLTAGAVARELVIDHGWRDRYVSWRLTKVQATEWDRYRAVGYVRMHDQNGDTLDHSVLAAALEEVASPALDTEVSRRLLKLAIHTRTPALDSLLVPVLIRALGNEEPQRRADIHQTLLGIARLSYVAQPVDSTLRDYRPGESETPADIQQWISRWRAWWTAGRARHTASDV